MVIDQDGAPQVWTAVYYRYHSRYEDEFPSFEEAWAFMVHGEDYGEMSGAAVRTPDGVEVDFDYIHGPPPEYAPHPATITPRPALP